MSRRPPSPSGHVRSGQSGTKIARMEFDLIRLLERSASAPTAIDSLEVVEGCGVDVMLELSLGLSSGKVECRKWARESNETVGVKKPKMEEGPMPYCLQVMPTIFIGSKGYCYSYMMPCWVLISMKVVGNNLYEPRDYPNLALEMDGVAAGDWKVVVAGESSGLSIVSNDSFGEDQKANSNNDDMEKMKSKSCPPKTGLERQNPSEEARRVKKTVSGIEF
ncbi:hypothetical protein IEQ34_000141 [Dendrobium chrysotoxum]|uniref:Uncharacterized protein n=1 Tax=Dendrobium chrysotoxum TaxID=161865 RepID=A0AAV7HSA6_DENCH|nr:hypothetical protein IEQ34_000141 [Dendrobium chrysotoxum]